MDFLFSAEFLEMREAKWHEWTAPRDIENPASDRWPDNFLWLEIDPDDCKPGWFPGGFWQEDEWYPSEEEMPDLDEILEKIEAETPGDGTTFDDTCNLCSGCDSAAMKLFVTTVDGKEVKRILCSDC
jgi:hypothetical protein